MCVCVMWCECVRGGSSNLPVGGVILCACVCVFACVHCGNRLDTPFGEAVMAVSPFEYLLCGCRQKVRGWPRFPSAMRVVLNSAAWLLSHFCHYNSRGDLCEVKSGNWKSKGKLLTPHSNYVSSLTHWFHLCIEMDLWTKTQPVQFLKQTLLTCLEPIQMTSAV